MCRKKWIEIENYDIILKNSCRKGKVKVQALYRNEHKYLIKESDLVLLEAKIKDVCNLDSHTVNGQYKVRSIYFDTINYQYYYENENGVGVREKWRIRMYDCDSKYLSLECKIKNRTMTHKKSCLIDKESVEQIIQGTWFPDIRELTNLQREFYVKYATLGLRASVIVDYERIPYTYEVGNVRITFDKYISGSKDFPSFFDSELCKIPILNKGMHVLEVKFDGILPDHIKNSLQTGKLNRIACSKYYLCKKYS
jgi:hypothetical protein